MQQKYAIIRVENGCGRQIEDVVVNEYKLDININDKSFARLLCSPHDLEYLCLGYLFGENKISSFADVSSINIDFTSGKANVYLHTMKQVVNDEPTYITTGLGPQKSITATGLTEGKTPLTQGLSLNAEKIDFLAEKFQEHSTLFSETGGVHSCALSDGKQIIAFFEDIGRHNALDKIVGYALKHQLTLTDYLLITSGRIPGYMAYKCYHAKLPIIISRSAVTSTAIDFAQATGLTLIGFARNSRFNIYSGEERIIWKKFY
ncbi:MAG: formate dehydrogenase accessory sulfurtransferase FdhD [Bacillota bacterium]|jgi:FdhD protein